MRRSPHAPRRQRKSYFTADSFERRRRMNAPLSRELRARFHRRSVPVRKGDTVRVLSGSFVGREERIAKVNRRDYAVTLDNVTLKTADEKLKPLELRLSHLVITRLNLSDPWRRRSLRVREEDVTPEERGETAEVPPEETAPVAEPSAPAEGAPEAAAPEAEDSTSAPTKRARSKKARPTADEEGDEAA